MCDIGDIGGNSLCLLYYNYTIVLNCCGKYLVVYYSFIRKTYLIFYIYNIL
jgi:hypothetical protein